MVHTSIFMAKLHSATILSPINASLFNPHLFSTINCANDFLFRFTLGKLLIQNLDSQASPAQTTILDPYKGKGIILSKRGNLSIITLNNGNKLVLFTENCEADQIDKAMNNVRYSKLLSESSKYIWKMLDIKTRSKGIGQSKRMEILMEYGGEFLDNIKLDPQSLMKMVKQVLKVLCVMESKRIVHGDLRMLNILWDKEKAVAKLTNFYTTKTFSTTEQENFEEALASDMGSFIEMVQELLKRRSCIKDTGQFWQINALNKRLSEYIRRPTAIIPLTFAKLFNELSTLLSHDSISGLENYGIFTTKGLNELERLNDYEAIKGHYKTTLQIKETELAQNPYSLTLKEEVAQAKYHLGIAYVKTGEHDMSLPFLLDSYQLFLSLKHFPEVLEVCKELILICIKLGDYKQIKEIERSILAISDEDYKAMACAVSGLVSCIEGEHKIAIVKLKAAKDALAKCSSDHQDFLNSVYNAIGFKLFHHYKKESTGSTIESSFSQKKEIDKALKHYEKVIDDAAKIKDE